MPFVEQRLGDQHAQRRFVGRTKARDEVVVRLDFLLRAAKGAEPEPFVEQRLGDQHAQRRLVGRTKARDEVVVHLDGLLRAACGAEPERLVEQASRHLLRRGSGIWGVAFAHARRLIVDRRSMIVTCLRSKSPLSTKLVHHCLVLTGLAGG